MQIQCGFRMISIGKWLNIQNIRSFWNPATSSFFMLGSFIVSFLNLSFEMVLDKLRLHLDILLQNTSVKICENINFWSYGSLNSKDEKDILFSTIFVIKTVCLYVMDLEVEWNPDRHKRFITLEEKKPEGL